MKKFLTILTALLTGGISIGLLFAPTAAEAGVKLN
jgi:hypothetical protein